MNRYSTKHLTAAARLAAYRRVIPLLLATEASAAPEPEEWSGVQALLRNRAGARPGATQTDTSAAVDRHAAALLAVDASAAPAPDLQSGVSALPLDGAGARLGATQTDTITLAMPMNTRAVKRVAIEYGDSTVTIAAPVPGQTGSISITFCQASGVLDRTRDQ